MTTSTGAAREAVRGHKVHAAAPAHSHYWRDDAACAGQHADWWTLNGNEHGTGEGVLTTANKRALWICATCPVAQPCIREAIALEDRGVIRGGIALWVRMEPYRCHGCDKTRLRVVSPHRSPAKRRRYCDDCVTAAQGNRHEAVAA